MDEYMTPERRGAIAREKLMLRAGDDVWWATGFGTWRTGQFIRWVTFPDRAEVQAANGKVYVSAAQMDG